MALLEVGKGCGRGCRFCLEGQVYRPVRQPERGRPECHPRGAGRAGGEAHRPRGACVSDYPWLGELLKVVEDNGMELSISSLRADSLTDDLVASLARGGHRTLTMAPEAGTERLLRRVIRKAISDEQLMAACDPRARARHSESEDLLHDRPADGDAPGRGGDPRPRGPDASSGCACWIPPGSRSASGALSISSFVPKPWTAVPVGALRRCRVAERQAGDDQARRAHLFQRARAAREPARGGAAGRCWRCATAAWATFLELAATAGGATGGARCASWMATPRSTRHARAPGRLSACRVTHFDVGVKKAVLVREWSGALAGEPALAVTGLTEWQRRSSTTRVRFAAESSRLGHGPLQTCAAATACPKRSNVWLPREEI